MRTTLILLLMVAIIAPLTVNAEEQVAHNITVYVKGIVWGGTCVNVGGEYFCLDKYNCNCDDLLTSGKLETIAFRVVVEKIDDKSYLRIIDGSIIPDTK
jgi:hypothetical protein